MSDRRSALLAVIAAVALGGGPLACATPAGVAPPGGPPAAGSACAGTWTTGSEGVAVVPFAGTVLGQAPDGTRRPIPGAKFVVVAGEETGRLPILTDDQGRFQGKVLLPTQGTRECRDGIIKVDYVIGIATISVRAKGCANTEVTVDAGWQPRAIDLGCEKETRSPPPT